MVKKKKAMQRNGSRRASGAICQERPLVFCRLSLTQPFIWKVPRSNNITPSQFISINLATRVQKKISQTPQLSITYKILNT